MEQSLSTLFTRKGFTGLLSGKARHRQRIDGGKNYLY